MRRSPLRRLQRSCVDQETPSRAVLRSELNVAHAVIAGLVWAHREGMRIAKDLLVTREMADRLELEAEAALSGVAEQLDERGVDTIMTAVAASQMARGDEDSAVRRWRGHLVQVRAFITAAEQMVEPRPQGGATFSDAVALGSRPPGPLGHGRAGPSPEWSDDDG